jgi:hypothetical protein
MSRRAKGLGSGYNDAGYLPGNDVRDHDDRGGHHGGAHDSGGGGHGGGHGGGFDGGGHGGGHFG